MTTYGFQDQSSRQPSTQTFGYQDYSSPLNNNYAVAQPGLSQTLDNETTARHMQMVADHWPELTKDPAALVGIVQGGGTDEQMFQRASQTVSMADLSTTADNLRQADPETQRAKFASMDAPRQAALNQLGYAPPAIDADKGGWTLSLFGGPDFLPTGPDLLTVGAKGAGGIMGAIGGGISDVLDAGAFALGKGGDVLNAPKDFLHHIQRFTEAQAETGGSRAAPQRLGAMFNVSEWANSWSRTTDGSHFFSKRYEDDARAYLDQHPWPADTLGPAPDPELRFQIARSIAAGDKARDYARGLGLDEQQNPQDWQNAIIKWNTIVADPEVRKAGEDLENGHVTLGRTTLPFTRDYHSAYGRLGSGAIDAWLAYKLDPVIMLSKYHQADLFMRYGQRLGSEAADLDKSVTLARAFRAGGEDAVRTAYDADGGVMDSSFRQTLLRAKGLAAKAEQTALLDDHTTAAAQRLLRDSPEAQMTYPSIVQWKAAQLGDAHLTPDRVFDFWQSRFGADSIVTTQGLRSHAVQLLPHLNPVQRAGLWTKGILTDAINVAADAGEYKRQADLLLPENQRLAAEKFSLENIDSVEQLFLDKAIAPVGRFFRELMTHGPYQQGMLDLGTRDGASEATRFANMGSLVGMTEPERQAWNARLLGDYNPITGKVTNNKGMVQATALQALDRMMEMGGIAGEDFAKVFVNRAAQQYGLSPDAFTRLGGTYTRTGVFSIDTANGMAIPSPMELIQATRGQSLTKAALGGYTASPFETWFSKVWKPLTLMHLGFIPRIAGEEMLGFALRKGPITAAQNTLGRWASEYEPALEVGGGMVDRPSPDSVAAMPIKWMSSNLLKWSTPEEGKPASGLHQLMGALDGYINRGATFWNDAVHGGASVVGIPSRRNMIQTLAGDKAIDDYYEVMNNPFYRRASSEHMSAAYWGHPDQQAAFDTVSQEMMSGGKKLRVDVPLRDDVAAQELYVQGGMLNPNGRVRGGDAYADTMMNALLRKTADPQARKLFAATHLTTEDQVTRIDRALTDMGYAGEVPMATEEAAQAHAATVAEAQAQMAAIQAERYGMSSYDPDWMQGQLEVGRAERRQQQADYWAATDREAQDRVSQRQYQVADDEYQLAERIARLESEGPVGAGTADPLSRVKAFKAHLDQHLGPQGRELAYQISDGDIPREEAAAALAEGTTKASTVEQRFAVGNLHKLMLNPSIRAEDWGLLVNDRLSTAALTTDRTAVTKHLVDVAENHMYDPANAEMMADLTLANFHDGLPVAAPITDGAAPLYFPMVDGPAIQKLRSMAIDPAGRARLRATLVEIFEQRGLDQSAIDHIMDGIAATDENVRTAHGTLLQGLALKRLDRQVPAGLWGSNDDRVAQAVTDAVDRVASGNKPAVLGTTSVPTDYWHRAEYPGRGLHAGPGRSYHVDPEVLTNPEPLPQGGLTMSEIRLKDGSTRWADDGQLERYRRGGQLDEVLRVQKRPGTPPSEAIRQLALAQANDTLDRVAPTDRGVLHSLLEPMTRGPKWEQDPQGVWHQFPSHLTPDHYISADGSLMPPGIYGPSKVAAPDTRWERLTNTWLEGMVQPALSALVRNPTGVQATAESARSLRGFYGNAWIDEATRNGWEGLMAKLGVSERDQVSLFRERDRLPLTLSDPDVSHANFTKVLANLFGIKLHTPEEAARLAELERTAKVSVVASAPGVGTATADEIKAARSTISATFAPDHPVQAALADAGLPSARWTDKINGQLTPEYWKSRDQIRTALAGDEFKDVRGALDALETVPRGGVVGTDQSELVNLRAKLADSTELSHQDMPLFRRYFRARVNVENQVAETSAHAGMQKMLPYIHDPSVRSHFQSYVGTLMPFMFAQEQFLKRWAKMFLDDPGIGRKIMLLHDGLRNTGMVQKDPYTGEDLIIWPGSNVINELMAKANPIWPGAGTFRGMAYSPLSGNLSMVIPGMGEPVAPNLGPTAGLALHGITNLFPEFAPLEDALASDKTNPDRNLAEWVVPSHLSQIYEGFVGDVDHGQLATIGKNAIAYQAAHGQGPPVDGTPHEQQDYLDRIRDFSRTQIIARGIFGLLGPPGGSNIDYHDALADDYRQMLADGVPIDQAMDLFMLKHKGEADPATVFPAYSVFATKSAAGAPLPQTQASVDFVDHNTDLIKAFPLAGAWLLPQSSHSAPRARQAYSQQLRTGLRDQRTPQEFMDQILFAEGADTYFAMSDQHRARVAALPVGSPALADENDNWKIISNGWRAQNPVFAKMLEDPTSSQRRQNVRDQLDLVLRSPDMPDDVGQADHLRTMLHEWHYLEDELGALKYSRRTTAVQLKEQRLPQQFIAWAHAYMAVHPDMTSFYNSVLRPDLPDEVIPRG